MKIILFVKTHTGKQINIELDSTDTIATLKKKISEKEGLDTNFQTIILAGKVLDDQKTIESYGKLDEEVLFLKSAKPEPAQPTSAAPAAASGPKR